MRNTNIRGKYALLGSNTSGQLELTKSNSAMQFRGLKYFAVLLLMLGLHSFSFGQTVGDYKTRQAGDWTDRTDWQRWDGDSWEIPTAGQGYPGQNAGTGVVTILNNISLNETPANPIGALVIGANLTPTNASITMTISGDFSISAGTFTLATNNKVGTYYVGGNFSFSGGTITETSSSTTSTIYFNGNKTQTYTRSGGTISNNIRFTVNSGTNLDVGTSIINGAGLFTLNSGATLTTAHANGLDITGNIQTTGGRIFNSGASLVFNGAVAQNIGTFAATTAGQINNLTINNASGVTLNTTSIQTINGNLNIINGALIFSNTARTITVAGNVTGSGTLDMTGAAHTLNIGGANSTFTGTLTAQSTSTIRYNGLSQTVFGSNGYQNLIIAGGGTKTLQGNVAVQNVLTLTSGVVQLGDYNLTLANTAAGAITGTYSATNMIETNSSGVLVKQGNSNASFAIVYPVGSGGYYTPMSLTGGLTATYTGTATLSVRAVSAFIATGILSKYWDVNTTNMSITSGYPLFTYNINEADASQASYIPWYKSGSTWVNPPNPTAAGVNPFGSTSTAQIAGWWTAGASAPPKKYYSYQSGSWNTATTWTTDPSGTTLVGSAIPAINDEVVILSNRVVTLPADITTGGLKVIINDGGVLDMATYQFTNTISSLSGQGFLKLASANFPTVTINSFVDIGGGTTEYYNIASFTLKAAQLTYNNLVINTSVGVTATQLNNLTLNGNLHVKQGTYRINDNTVARRQLTINGDVTVDTGANITVGTGNTSSGDTNGATTPTPFTDYYDLNTHRFVVYGNFTNSGTVKFTNQDYPDFDSFPTDGAATVYFRGTSNNTLSCNGVTNFYNLVLDKGIDQSFSLTIHSTAYPNFKLFGRNDLGGENGGANPDLRKALWIRNGTLILQGLTVIPSLTEGVGAGSPNGDYYIPANGALVLDGSEVVVLSTADSYQEINAAWGLSAPNTIGVASSGGAQSFSVYGKFQVNSGYFSTRESGGLITWNVSSGQFVINGGTIDAKQFRSAGGGGGLASYTQAGGELILRGRFQRIPIAYTSVSDLINAPINTTRAISGLNGALGTFNLNEPANVFTMSGGTIRIYDVCGDGSVAARQKVFEVLSSTGNINVTGGTLELIPTTGTGTNSPNQIIISNASLGNLTVNRASSASVVLLNTYPLTVLNTFNLMSGDFNANNLDVTVGGNFTIASGTTYTPGSNWTILNGSSIQTMTVNLGAALALNKFKIDKPAGTTLTLAGSQSNVTVNDSLIIAKATFADGGKTISLAGTIATASYLYNSGLHTGAGKIVLNDNVPQLITGDGNGVFQNLELNNNTGTAPISLGANITINGTLTLSQDKLFNIGANNLKLGPTATVANAGSARYIQTAGNAGDGGITKEYSAASTSFTFPVGAPTIIPARAVKYTPATIAVNGTPTAYGSITIIPVGYEHPATKLNGFSLTYFWRVKSSGFTLGAATVTHGYTYGAADMTGITTAECVTARYNPPSYAWFVGNINDVDETNRIIGEPGAGSFLENVSFIDGDYTAGDNIGQNPFAAPTRYYSRRTGNWSTTNTWSLTDHNTDNVPAAAPGVNDVVIIGNGHTVTLTANASSASLQIEENSILNVQTFTGGNFGMVLNHPSGKNGKIRVTSSNAALVRVYSFPGGDFSDFNVNKGTTEFYSTDGRSTALSFLPSTVRSYGNLMLTPFNQDNLALPNTDVTIYGDLTCQGTDINSWIAISYYNAALYPTIEKTVYIKGNVNILGGSLIYTDDYAPQHLIIDGNITIANNIEAALDVRGNAWVGGGVMANTLAVGGTIINNNLFRLRNNTRYCDITFNGFHSASISNTAGNPNTVFNKVIVNKGSTKDSTLTIDIAGTLTTLTDDWLTLQNGTLRYMRNNPSSDFTISAATRFTIPSTAGLYIDYPNNSGNRNILIANAAVNDNDLFLEGKLTVVNGNVYIGPTNGTTNNNNDIEYSGGGASTIDIQGGNLMVNGQIRRNAATTNGVLKYFQSGGNLVVNGQASIPGKAKLEVVNAGSVFNMSGGTITVVRGGGTTYGDLYIRAESSSVTGGEIIFTQSPTIGPGVDAVQNYTLDAIVALNNLTITGRTATALNATVSVLISPLTLNGNLTLSNSYSILDMNSSYDINLTVKGGFTNNGTYRHYNNTTTFNGGAQTIAGTSATDFYNLIVNPVTSLSLIRDINVFNDLTLSRGQFLINTYNVNLKGDFYNNANYDGDATLGGVIMNGTSAQQISGTGTYGRLEIANFYGVRAESSITLKKNLKLTNGIFDINEHLLTLETTSAIEGSGFGQTKMITSDGVFSNVGVRKYFSIYSGADKLFTFPIGTSGKYTPALLTYSNNSNVGYVRINNINDNHPAVFDENNVLQYYWEVESSGIANFNGNLSLNYNQDDVSVTGTNTEALYIAAALRIPGSSWQKAGPGGDDATDFVYEGTNEIKFTFSGENSISGEYTAGIDPALPDLVPEFISVKDGDWSDPTTWVETTSTGYVLTGAPRGFIMVIDAAHTVKTDINYVSSYRTTINGRLEVNASTYGHNLGTVYGNGTLYLENSTLPAGRYTDFFSCSENSTLEYGGTSSYTVVADLYDELAKLYFTGSGTKTLPNKDLTICKRLLINGPTLNNSAYNKKLTIRGTMERLSGSFNSGSGAGATVSFAGSTAQTIGGTLGNFTGANAFNNFEINNPLGLTVNNAGAIEVAGNLLLTSGNITTSSTATLTITNTAINCVTPSGGSSSSYVDGPLSKRINQGDNFLFPVGKGSSLGNKITLSSTQTGTILWTVEFFTPNATYTSMTSPLTYVNSKEYWTVTAPSGSQAIINLKWDPMSDLTPLMTQNGLSDMRVAQYNSGTTSWEELASTATGDNNYGTVYTNSRITIPAAGSSNFATACVNVTKPRARLNPSGAVCGDEGIPIVFSGSGLAYNYIITYKKGGVLQPAVNITSADIPYTLPTDATGTTYQLISFTYNSPTSPTTGVVDPAIVTSYTLPTTADIGSDGGLDDDDQSICGGTTVTLNGNSPVVGSGLWTIISGTGGTVEFPTVNNSDFDGTNGTNYTLRWTITNGGCTSSDDVNISFPLLPEKPAAFILSDNTVCQGDNDVDYSVANNPSLTYNWSYTGGLGATISGSGYAIQIDYAVTATSGTVEVYTTNGCGDSAPLTLAVTVNTLPVFTVTGSETDLCDEDLFDLTTTFTSINPDYHIAIVLDGTPVTGSPFTSSNNPYVYSDNFAWSGPAADDTHSFTVIVTDKNGCASTLVTPVTFKVWKIPETGPQYHVPNTYGF
ncbi:hypothetical protein CYCD_08360 [Tenuifilaceae bacterium CYCD]|nr:hypothetical protein CYCD_08360 [Tenuifilaceae bacterium CYCD]